MNTQEKIRLAERIGLTLGGALVLTFLTLVLFHANGAPDADNIQWAGKVTLSAFVGGDFMVGALTLFIMYALSMVLFLTRHPFLALVPLVLALPAAISITLFFLF